MNEKFQNQQSSFSAIAKDICSIVFENVGKFIKKLIENWWKHCFRNKWWIWSMQTLQCKTGRKNDYIFRYIKEMFDGKLKRNKGELDNSNTINDRDHQAVSKYLDYVRNGKYKAIRFTTFRHRALLYLARKKSEIVSKYV